MAWSLVCQADGQKLNADSKEALADKVMQHANSQHKASMNREQAMQMVNKDARQAG